MQQSKCAKIACKRAKILSTVGIRSTVFQMLRVFGWYTNRSIVVQWTWSAALLLFQCTK